MDDVIVYSEMLQSDCCFQQNNESSAMYVVKCDALPAEVVVKEPCHVPW